MFCREISFVANSARDEGGSQKVTNDDEGEGGVTIPPKIDDVIYEQPLIVKCICPNYKLDMSKKGNTFVQMSKWPLSRLNKNNICEGSL